MAVTNYAVKYSRELDQAIQQGTLTNRLVTKDLRWIDAKTVKISTLSVGGYKDHNREGGFREGSWTQEAKSYDIKKDRSIQHFLDRMDVDETNQAVSAANITKVFMDENANPEIDAYRFSKLAAEAGIKTEENHTDAEKTFKRLKEDINKIRKYGTSDAYCYVSSEVMDLIEEFRSDKMVINITNEGTTIETRVTRINGVEVIEVLKKERFYDSYDFTDGFRPVADVSKGINWIVVSKKSIIVAEKLNSVYLFKPGQHSQGDGYLYQNRLYHDLFVLENKKDGVVVSISEDVYTG